MSILNSLLSNVRKADIGDGIHENVVVLSATNQEKVKKDGTRINRNSYTKFGKFGTGDKAKTITEIREISWFNIKHDSGYSYDNLLEQIVQMAGIVEAVSNLENAKKAFNPIFDKFDIEDISEDLEDLATNKKDLAAFQEEFGFAYAGALKGYMGEDGTLIRVKFVYENTGQYVQQPKFGKFTEPMEVSTEDSQLKLTQRDLDNRAKAATGGQRKPASPPKMNI